jgi:regulator of PEP synthase PpsR (kinase-PPPase family)
MPAETNYAMREHVRQELEFANNLFVKHPEWPVIDVTGRAIEETAVIILEAMKERDDRNKAARSQLV